MRSTHIFTLLAAMALAPAFAAAEPTAKAQVREILASLEQPRASAADAARRLTKLGTAALPALVAEHRRAAARRDVQAREADASVDVLERAIASHRVIFLERHLDEYVRSHEGTAARLDALHTLAVFGRRSSLALAIDLVDGVERTAVGSRAVVSAWQAVLHTVFDDRASVTRLLSAWRRVPQPLHAPTAQVLAERGTRTELAAVLTMVQRADEGIPELLRVLDDASPVVLSKLPLIAALLEFRKHRERGVRLAVARLLGRSGRSDAFQPLVDLLDDDDGGVQRAAVASLRALTGASAGSSAESWKRWRMDEIAWRKQSKVSLALHSDRPVEVARALREIGKHPFIGTKDLLSIVRLVDRGTDGVRVLACATLVRLNRASVAPDLVRHLNDGDGALRNAVWKALRALSGEDHPAQARAWSDAAKRWRS